MSTGPARRAGVRFRPTLALALAALLLPLSEPSLSAAAAGRVRFADSIKEVPVGAPSTGPHRVRDQLRPDELGQRMGFVVSLRMRNFAELEARVQSGQRVSQPEMEAKYLPLAADYDRVEAWLRSQGFAVNLRFPNHTNIFASGTVAQVSSALEVTFARVATSDGEFTSAVTAPSLPADLSAAVLAIGGLQPHILMHVPKPQPSVITTVDGFVTPADIDAAYDVPVTPGRHGPDDRDHHGRRPRHLRPDVVLVRRGDHADGVRHLHADRRL
jgi:hypothetical protein